MIFDEFAALVPGAAAARASLESYAELLDSWNSRINLVGKNTLADLWRRHFLDSAQLMAHLPPEPESRPRIVVDLGSGAGFPGMVLALLGAGHIHLVESDQRKATFLREAARVTEASVTIQCKRIEALEPIPADLVTARALAPLPKLLGYAACFSSRNGSPILPCLFLKGARADEELTAAQKAWKISVESFSSLSDSSGVILSIGLEGREPSKR